MHPVWAAEQAAAAQAAAEATGKDFDASAFAAQFYPGLGFAYTDFVLMQIVGVVFFGIFTLLSGPIADSIGRRKLLLWVTGLIIVFGFTFNAFLLPAIDPKFTGALAQALRGWLTDAGLRRDLRAAARERRETLADWSVTSAALSRVLVEVAA